jgi:hypothetical protein
VEGRTRDLAMFNLAIDSKLRGCDVVAIKVEDVAPHGYAADRATVRQRKTGHGQPPQLLRMTIMRDHSKALDSRRLSNNFRHRMPAGAGRVGSS